MKPKSWRWKILKWENWPNRVGTYVCGQGELTLIMVLVLSPSLIKPFDVREHLMLWVLSEAHAKQIKTSIIW